jgi:hypothetical protein
MTLPTLPREHDHTSVRDWFAGLGRSPSIPVYVGQHEDGWDLGVHCAVAPVSYRQEALSKPGWDLLHGPHGPGFSQSQNEDGEWETVYFRLSSGELEPLVIEREFHGVRPGYRELSEEFRLFHNLYASKDGKLLRIDDAGAESVAAEIRPGLSFQTTSRRCSAHAPGYR